MPKGKIDLSVNDVIYLDASELTIVQGDLKDLHSREFEKLKKSILSEGIEPLTIWQHPDRSNRILNGTQRYRVICKLIDEGYELGKIPCRPRLIRDERHMVKVIADLAGQYGKMNEQGFYELAIKYDANAKELLDSAALFDDDQKFLENFFEETQSSEGEDEVPESRTTQIKRGDLFQLGNHRLLCGDATSKEDVELLMNGEKADMVYTDPPYGISYDNQERWAGTKKQSETAKINRGEMIVGDDREFDPSYVFDSFDYCKEIFLWGMQYYLGKLPDGGVVVWNRKTKEQEECPFADFELCWSKTPRNAMAWIIWGGWISKEKGEERLHTTQKPISLAEWFFERWGKDKPNVVDVYLGSGSTLIACEKTNRRCFGMEIDPQYCQVIIDRWEKFTGEKAVPA